MTLRLLPIKMVLQVYILRSPLHQTQKILKELQNDKATLKNKINKTEIELKHNSCN